MTERVVLPEDVIIVAVTQLAPDMRMKLECDDGDYAISRPHGRASSKIVDAESVELLNHFRQPITIVDGVIAYSQARRLDPEPVLENAFPLLRRLFNDGLLVPEGSEDAAAIGARLADGDRVGVFELVTRMQVLEDTEVYRAQDTAGRAAVVKIARRAHDQTTAHMLAREARILARLDGNCAPLLFEEGEQQGRRYFAMEFIPGLTAVAAADELRARRDGAAEAILSLCCAIAEAYKQLHARGVLHADIHPRNLLVTGNVVRIIDFGLARIEPPEPGFAEPRRGGIGFYFEPEYARSRRGDKIPHATTAGEQYALGALLYRLVTGAHYADFSLERDRLLQQIVETPPLPFAHHGLAPWPELELVLARALAKEPLARYEELSELSRALTAVRPSAQGRELRRSNPQKRDAVRKSAGAALLDSTLQQLCSTGDVLHRRALPPPTCSVNFGAAGIAYLLYRVACLRDDPRLLSDADLWITRALHDCGNADAFHNPEIGIARSVVGDVSLFHSVTGLHCVRALIAQAMGDFGSLPAALQAFVAAARVPSENLDLTLGRAGLLLGCSAILEALPASHPFVDPSSIRILGTEIMDDLWRRLDALNPIAKCTEQPLLGVAHGWGGFLFATMRWCEASASARPQGMSRRLEELADCGQEHGRGVRWPRKIRPGRAPQTGDFAPSWCNGSTGLVHVWLLAHSVTGDSRYATLAERAGLDSWDCRELFPNLCCGLAGRAYASLALYRATRSPEWLERANEQVEEATACSRSDGMAPFSLFKGDGGVALVAADLTRPDCSCLPLFDSEGWSQPKATGRTVGQ